MKPDEEGVTDVSQSPPDPLTQASDDVVNAVQSDEALARKYTVLWVECKNEGRVSDNSEDHERMTEEIIHSLDGHGEQYKSVIEKTLLELFNGRAGSATGPTRQEAHIAADPVMMFNGEFVHESEDLRISGAGLDFVFRRTYRNQSVYYGPLGANWDHAYNLHLRASDTQLTLWTGGLREEIFTLQQPSSGGSYFAPPDGVDAIFETRGDSFVRRAPDGVQHIFEPDDPVWTDLHRLKQIEDRFGNFLEFSYNGDGLLGHVRVNHPERIIQFDYDTIGRIIAVTDYASPPRTWRYDYDDWGDLARVTTPHTERYPNGLTTTFEYSTPSTSGLSQHNLVRIIDPANQTYLQNEYGMDAGQLDFNRVVRQRQGGGQVTFEYENIVPVFEHDYTDAQRPAHQTNMMERNGHLVHFIYNKFGNLLLKEEYILERGLPRLVVWRYRYNRDGKLTAMLSSEGVMTQSLCGREYFAFRNNITDEEDISGDERLTAEQRLGFGRLLATVQRAGYRSFTDLNITSGAWGDVFPPILSGPGEPDPLAPDDIVVKFTYEPRYNQLLTVSDPRSTRSASPEHTESDAYQKGLTHLDYAVSATDPLPPGDIAVPSNPLFLRRIRKPEPTLPDGTLAGPVTEEFTDYDTHGRLRSKRDAVGTLTEYAYFDDTGTRNGIREGYLQRMVIGPGGLTITTEYEVDELGRVTATHLPRSFSAAPGPFITHADYNELDQVVRVTSSAPFNSVTRRFYDRNGKLEREELDARDANGAEIPDAPEVRTFEYDEELNLLRETIGGVNLAAHLATSHRYDVAGKRVLTILPRGNQLRYSYDERLLPVSQTKGAGTDDAATTRTEYDADGRVRRTRNARGHAATLTLDAFGRVIVGEDAFGHITRRTYDRLGNVTVERAFERRDASSYALMSRSEYAYDLLGRAITVAHNRFDEPFTVVDVANLENVFLSSPGPGELMTTHTFYDAKGRILRIVDAMRREHHFEYDALDRVTVEMDALGNRIENHYDAHGNLTRRDARDLVRDATGVVVGERIFSQSSTYDELDRRTTATDSLGNTTRYAYDSRGHLTLRIDPLGNVARTEFDIYGRQVRQISEQTETGLGGGNPLAPSVTLSEYDANGNLTGLVDALLRRTQHTFDALDRRRSIIYPDSRESLFSYDADGNLTLTQDNNGLRRHFTLDALGRTTRVEVDRSGLAAGIVIAGANFESYTYDARGLKTQEENDFARCDVRYNSLGWPLSETLTVTTPDALRVDPLVITRSFNNAGAITELTYPQGRRLHYHRDELDRLTRLENRARGVAYPGHPATSHVHDIASFHYAGTQRTRCASGNGSTINYSHDGAGRQIEIAHASGATPILTIQYLFDAIGNPRFRNDITPAAQSGEAFNYDSFYRLAHVQPGVDLPLFDPNIFAPAAAIPPDPIPNRQADINARIGSLALPSADKTFSYDLVGNRRREQLRSGGALVYAVNDLDQYTQVDGTNFIYDHNGNLRNDGEREYHYDSLNRLVRVIGQPGVAEINFFHDVRGRRILEQRPGLTTHLVYDGPNLIAEYRNGVLFAQYAYDDGVDRPLQLAVERDEFWYHTDLTGSVRLLTGRDGSTRAAYNYDPFGDAVGTISDTPHNSARYAARRLDEDLQTYDFRARQYDPQLGRFTQRDPTGMADGTNVYAYAGNNPLGFNDRFGTKREANEMADSDSDIDIRIPDGAYDKRVKTFVSELKPEIEIDLTGKKINLVKARGSVADITLFEGRKDTKGGLSIEGAVKVILPEMQAPIAYKGGSFGVDLGVSAVKIKASGKTCALFLCVEAETSAGLQANATLTFGKKTKIKGGLLVGGGVTISFRNPFRHVSLPDQPGGEVSPLARERISFKAIPETWKEQGGVYAPQELGVNYGSTTKEGHKIRYM